MWANNSKKQENQPETTPSIKFSNNARIMQSLCHDNHAGQKQAMSASSMDNGVNGLKIENLL